MLEKKLAVLHLIIPIQICPNSKVQFDEYAQLELIRLSKRCAEEFLKGPEVLRHTEIYGKDDGKGLLRAKPRYSQNSKIFKPPFDPTKTSKYTHISATRMKFKNRLGIL